MYELHWTLCISTLILIWEMMNAGIIIYKIRIYCREATLACIKLCFELHTVKRHPSPGTAFYSFGQKCGRVYFLPVLYTDCTATSTTFMITSHVASASASFLVFLSWGASVPATEIQKPACCRAKHCLNVTPSNHSCVGGTRTLWVGKLQRLIVIMQMSLFISYPE